LIKSNNGGAMKINLIINGIIRIRIYASQGEVGGTLGITNTSSMDIERGAIAMNLSIYFL
jgi:DNA-binding XRE family transcriptional regulator